MRFIIAVSLLYVVTACSGSPSNDGEREIYCAEARYLEEGFRINYSDNSELNGTIINIPNQEAEVSKLYTLQIYVCGQEWCMDSIEEAEFNENGDLVNGC